MFCNLDTNNLQLGLFISQLVGLFHECEYARFIYFALAILVYNMYQTSCVESHLLIGDGKHTEEM